MQLDGKQTKHLREGGVFVGKQYIMATEIHNGSGLWLCGTETQVQTVLGNIPESIKTLLDSGEELLYEVEDENGWTRFIADLDGDLGEIPFRYRHALCLMDVASISPDKALPLPAQIEDELAIEIQNYKKVIRFRADGSFEMD